MKNRLTRRLNYSYLVFKEARVNPHRHFSLKVKYSRSFLNLYQGYLAQSLLCFFCLFFYIVGQSFVLNRKSIKVNHYEKAHAKTACCFESSFFHLFLPFLLLLKT